MALQNMFLITVLLTVSTNKATNPKPTIVTANPEPTNVTTTNMPGSNSSSPAVPALLYAGSALAITCMVPVILFYIAIR